MTVDMNKVIDLCKSRVGKVTYSMYGARNIMSSTCDCSGMVFTAMMHEGAKNSLGYIGSTITEKKFLEENGLECVYKGQGVFNAKKGDVFIWAPAGLDRKVTDSDLVASAGAAGHTGIFTDDSHIIHCNYGYNGISINDYNTILNANQPYYTGGVAEFIFRKKTTTTDRVTSVPKSGKVRVKKTDYTRKATGLNDWNNPKYKKYNHPKGDILNVVKIVKTKTGLTQLQLDSGNLFTANKNYVEIV
jgi:hypothetical protein